MNWPRNNQHEWDNPYQQRQKFYIFSYMLMLDLGMDVSFSIMTEIIDLRKDNGQGGGALP